MTLWTDQAVILRCQRDAMIGVLSTPCSPASRGVVIVVGGPQYRAGSHRQFTLLARQLAQAGIAALRFDHRGMGDSAGSLRGFERIGEDIRCAVDALTGNVPGLKEVVLWGLCDAASAVLFYAHQDPRVTGVVLLNPWVRTEQGLARAHVRHYYPKRLIQAAFWKKLIRGEVDFRRAGADAAKFVWRAVSRARTQADAASLPDRMRSGLSRFRGRVLLILSGNDLTAQEFGDLTAASPGWRHLLEAARVTRRHLREANHTFARSEWRNQVARWTTDWINGDDQARRLPQHAPATYAHESRS